MKNIIWIFIVIFPLNFQVMNSFAYENGVTVFFGNGMFNTKKKAIDSRDIIEKRIRAELPSVDLRFRCTYNQQELDNLTGVPAVDFVATGIGQFFEVLVQKQVDKVGLFWDMLSGAEAAPDWFEEMMGKLASSVSEISYVVDEDLSTHVALYENQTSAGRKVIVVAHSQGNFYANLAHAAMTVGDIEIVAVATPARYVAGDGEHITLTNDLVIGAVRLLDEDTLEPNTINESSIDWTGHSFIDSYLYGEVSGPRIIENILGAIVYTPPVFVDNDSDGYSEVTGDCDDSDYWVNPGVEEVCDGYDNDCDELVDEGCVPNAPSYLTVIPTSPYELQIGWQDNSENEDGFEIKLNIPSSSGPTETTVEVDYNPVNAVLLLSGREWKVWVRSFNSYGRSDWIYESGVSPMP